MWNRAARDGGSHDRESPPLPPPDRTKTRAPPRPHPLPSPHLSTTHSFRNAACSEASSAAAAWPGLGREKTQTKLWHCPPWKRVRSSSSLSFLFSATP